MAKTPQLTPYENDWYRAQTNQARRQANVGFAQNQYERRIASAQNKWDVNDTKRQFQRQFQTLNNPFNQRGLMASGIRNRAWRMAFQDRDIALQRLTDSGALRNQGFNMVQTQLAQAQRAALDDLRRQKLAQRQTLAATIRGATSF